MAGAAKKSSWLDENSNKPLIEDLSRRSESFLAAVADGRIDKAELTAQEGRLVALLRDVEPKLDGELHAQVTQLLCELTAYDLMQFMHTMHESRPRSEWRP